MVEEILWQNETGAMFPDLEDYIFGPMGMPIKDKRGYGLDFKLFYYTVPNLLFRLKGDLSKEWATEPYPFF